MNPLYDVIIIGAGASGLICALETAKRGLKTLVLEKADVPGRKILVSGNGRCNLTNSRVSPACYNGDRELVQTALNRFSFHDCKHYFEDLGVLLTEEDSGRWFPATGKATAVTEPLKLAALEHGAEILTGREVIRAQKRGKTFTVQTKTGETHQSKNLVLACGSCAYPQVTGTNAGYELAQSFGHTVIAPRPTLCALNIQEKALARLQGIRCQARLTAVGNGAEIARAEGEILFTNYGLSGPAALNISGETVRHLAGGNVTLLINFFPEIADLKEFMRQRVARLGARKPKDFFAGILHESVANLLIDFIGLRKNIPMNEQTPNTLARVASVPGAWPVTAVSGRPWTEAMAAAGGVNTREINYNTFESRKCPRLFITGELLNVDGKSGGFNLHFAWSSGVTAARSMPED